MHVRGERSSREYLAGHAVRASIFASACGTIAAEAPAPEPPWNWLISRSCTNTAPPHRDVGIRVRYTDRRSGSRWPPHISSGGHPRRSRALTLPETDHQQTTDTTAVVSDASSRSSVSGAGPGTGFEATAEHGTGLVSAETASPKTAPLSWELSPGGVPLSTGSARAAACPTRQHAVSGLVCVQTMSAHLSNSQDERKRDAVNYTA